MEIIEISNHPLGFKRKVFWKGYQHLWDEEVIKLFTICRHYEDNNGEYGAEINTLAFKAFERILTARKGAGKFVDVDGMTLIKQENESYLRADNQQTPTQVIDQYDFFNNIIKTTSVNIPTLGRNVILVEDQVHKTYDK